MTNTGSARDTPRIVLYFAPLTLLIYLVAPEYLLDIPTSYMLKNQLHASAPQISMFRLLTAVPVYLAFVFGMVRDRWNPFGLRDRGLMLLFAPLTALIYGWMAFGHVSYAGLLLGMTVAMLAFRLVVAAYQGLIALVAQEALMTGRLSTLWNTGSYLPIALAVYAAGFVSEHMTVRETFLAAAALTLLVAVFGLWKPRAVFDHTYDLPQAQASSLLVDLRRLLRHRAIYPAVLINFLWYFTPGIGTPMQFYMTNHLHTSDALFADYMSLYTVSFVPTILLYGFLCTHIRQRTLLWSSALIGVPQMLPLLFAHTGQFALLMAVPMGMMGGMANAAFYDLAIRSCPPGLQGTFMMLIVALMALAFRGSDLLGSWIYASSPTHGFQYCVIAMVSVYALILPIIALVPKQVTATTDGQASAPA
ncbi:MAG: MFS transporter [Steroidobacteraceae bacterium]|jgi:MFS family permease